MGEQLCEEGRKCFAEALSPVARCPQHFGLRSPAEAHEPPAVQPSGRRSGGGGHGGIAAGAERGGPGRHSGHLRGALQRDPAGSRGAGGRGQGFFRPPRSSGLRPGLQHLHGPPSGPPCAPGRRPGRGRPPHPGPALLCPGAPLPGGMRRVFRLLHRRVPTVEGFPLPGGGAGPHPGADPAAPVPPAPGAAGPVLRRLRPGLRHGGRGGGSPVLAGKPPPLPPRPGAWAPGCGS